MYNRNRMKCRVIDMTLNIKLNTLEETEKIAEVMAEKISRGAVITLKGGLGAGKTTFSQFFGRALGVSRRITSPTFNIIKSYPLDGYTFHHMDCYRLEYSEEDLGFDEYFNNDDISIIEWPDFIEEFLPDQFLEITIKVENGERLFYIDNHGGFDYLMEALNDFTID